MITKTLYGIKLDLNFDIHNKVVYYNNDPILDNKHELQLYLIKQIHTVVEENSLNTTIKLTSLNKHHVVSFEEYSPFNSLIKIEDYNKILLKLKLSILTNE